MHKTIRMCTINQIVATNLLHVEKYRHMTTEPNKKLEHVLGYSWISRELIETDARHEFHR